MLNQNGPTFRGRPPVALGPDRTGTQLTRRNESEELRSSTAIAEALVQSSLDGIIVVDQEGKIILQNQRVIDLWKIPDEIARETADGKQIQFVSGQTRNPKEFVEKIEDLYAQPLKTSRDTIELVDGTILDRSSAPVHDRNGKYYGRVWSFREATEQKRAERRIADELNFNRTILEAAPFGILTYRATGEIISFNEAAARLIGAHGEQLAGTNFRLLDSWKESGLLETAERALRRGSEEEIESHFKTSYGKTVWLSFRFVPFQYKGEQHLLLMFTDIEERKRSEAALRDSQEQLREAQKMEAIGTLAGGIAHDFNNILGAITGYTELAKMDLEDRPETLANLEAVSQAAQRATSLVRQILAFSRKQPHEKKVIQLRHIVAEALKLLRASIPATINIKTSLNSSAHTVLADANQIHQIIMNLAANAWHAMRHQPGILNVSLENVTVDQSLVMRHADLRPGPYVRLTVSDTGHGMDAQTMQRIFEPFFTTKNPGEGTGLGLAVVHGIMKTHEGAILVESEVGKGTSFHLFFPAHQEVCLEAISPLSAIPRGAGQRILLLDDEPPLVTLWKAALERLGYVVEAHTKPAEALDEIKSAATHFDLVLTDLAMPTMSGLEFTRAALTIRPDLPMILMTGYAADLTVEYAKTIGLRDLLMKPLTMETIAVSIDRALTASTSSRAMERGRHVEASRTRN